MPSDSGVTSSSSISRRPLTRMSACTAAPSATTSSGFSSLCGVAAEQLLDHAAHERDARRAADEHRLRRCPSAARPASASAWRHGSSVRSTSGADERFELGARDARAIAGVHARRRLDANLGLVELGQIPLRLDDRLADGLRSCSAASCCGFGSLRDVASSTCSISSRSMSSPPRCVSPLVASTWNTPSSTFRIEMSNVPPPRSYTAIVPRLRLSRP